MRGRLPTVILAMTVLAGAPAGAPASASAAGRYVAIGDSIAAASNSYVDRYAARLGIADVRKLLTYDTAVKAVGSVLPTAVTLIGDETDTVVVTLQIGGHDYLENNCYGDFNRPTCDFADGLNDLLGGLRAALDADPGDERLTLVGYYNPASGLGNTLERDFDLGFLGTDGRVDTSAHGDAWGYTDVTAWLACRYAAAYVDPWAAFKAGGQALMADPLHPNPTGQQILAELVGDPSAGGPPQTCPPTTPFATTDPDRGDGRARGSVEPRLAPARWWFEYGPTAAYGSSTPVGKLQGSAAPRAVAARLPASPPNTVFHVRLVVENDRGRHAGEDRVVTIPEPPQLRAALRGQARRRLVLARGVALRIRSTGTSVAVRGWLRRRGRDPLVLDARLHWFPQTTRTVRVTLTTRGAWLLRRATRPRLALRLTATGRSGTSKPVRLSLRLR